MKLLEEPNYISAIIKLSSNDFNKYFTQLINELVEITYKYSNDYPNFYQKEIERIELWCLLKMNILKIKIFLIINHCYESKLWNELNNWNFDKLVY